MTRKSSQISDGFRLGNIKDKIVKAVDYGKLVDDIAAKLKDSYTEHTKRVRA